MEIRDYMMTLSVGKYIALCYVYVFRYFFIANTFVSEGILFRNSITKFK